MNINNYVDQIIDHWKTGSVESQTMTSEIFVLSREINKITSDEEISEIATKIKGALSDQEVIQNLQQNRFSSSIAGGISKLDVAMNAVRLALLTHSNQATEACAEAISNLKIPNDYRPPLNEDIYSTITSNLSTIDHGKLLSVSKEEREMALKEMVKRINIQKIPLNAFGLNSLEEAEAFFGEHSKEIRYLDLRPWKINDKNCEILKKSFPNINHLFIQSDIITDAGLRHLEGMPLTSVSFNVCGLLTDAGLSHLEGMSLTSVSFNGCRLLTDAGLRHLEGMPLTSVSFDGCNLLSKNIIDSLIVK